MRERWINSEQKLEQWFDIAHRPEGAEKGLPLTVQMTLDSELKITQKGNNIQFSNSKGIDITYNKLKVWDSTGRELPARMQLVSNTLNLLVDDGRARYPVTIDPVVTMLSVQQQAYIKSSNPEFSAKFGSSVAISGDTLVVGAPGETDERDIGAAYVFTRNDSTWTQQAYLHASNAGDRDGFGVSVAISGDTLVVGAWREGSCSTGVNGDESDNTVDDAGAAYVFTRNDATWSQQAYLKASNTGANDWFGGSVAISGDTVVVVGAIGVGTAYVFTRSDSTWSQQANLQASNQGLGDHFGISVAISGNTLVVGASLEESNSTGVNGDQSDNSVQEAGAAYVFIRNDATWSQQAYLKASNPDRNDYFGHSVSISGDTVVVGAFNKKSGDRIDNNIFIAGSGAAYVFTRNDATWSQQAYLKASNADNNDYFGHSVSISNDTLVVGALWEDSSSTGVNGDQSDNSAQNSGAAYVFTRNDAAWSQQAYLKAPNARFGHSFGNSVALSGDTLVVGAFRDTSLSTGVNGDQSDDSIFGVGAAHVYDIDYSLTASKTGNGSGGVSSNPDGIDCGDSCSALFEEDTVVTLTASASADSQFTGWSGAGCSDTGSCVVTMDTAKTVTAEFKLLPQLADLVMILSENPNLLFFDFDVFYTVSIYNLGPNPAENVMVSDPLLSEETAIVTNNGCLSNPQNGLDQLFLGNSPTCNLGTIAVGEFASYTLQVPIYPSSVPFNLLSVASDTLDLDNDNNIPNNNRVFGPPIVETLWTSIATGTDDAEENISNGDMYLNSTDLEMSRDGRKQQKVGLRFTLEIPAGATIEQASIQFTTDETSSDITHLTVYGEATLNALSFSNTDYDISDRTLTTESVSWSPLAWTTAGEAGINQPLTMANGADDSVERNDSVGYPVAEIVSFGPETGAETIVSTLGMSAEEGAVVIEADGSFSYTPFENYVGPDSFAYTLSNGVDPDSTATVYLEVLNRGEVIPLWIPVNTGSDDAEQDVSSGEMDLTSSDLEMTRDKSSTQLVGVRFQQIDIPFGARIEKAYIQFTTDETSDEQTVLTVTAEASSNAATFSRNDFDISNRPQIVASVEWTLSPWNTKGVAREEQMTPDLSTLVQVIVDQGNWLAGNPMVFIISGSGKRVAESFNGTAAPVLHLEYSLPLPF